MSQYIKTFNDNTSNTLAWGSVVQVSNLPQPDGSTIVQGTKHIPTDAATSMLLDAIMPLIPSNAVAQQGAVNATITNGAFTGQYSASVKYSDNGVIYTITAHPNQVAQPVQPAQVAPATAVPANSPVVSNAPVVKAALVRPASIQGMKGT